MADDPDFSKPVDVKKPMSLEKHVKETRISSAYEQAKSARQQQQQEKAGSEQVRKSAPGMHLRPKGMARSGPDAQAHSERLKAEQQKHVEKARKALESRKDKGKEERER